ncbi:MAG: metal-dependent hydrolase [Caldilineales bacterium]|nr:metal-dependent hydrolase [Caldilineales bacterium]
MLPTSHAAYTLAAYQFLKNRKSLPVPDVDLRLLVLAAWGPDLIDKPLASLYFYQRYGSAVLFAHTLLVHLAVALITLRRFPQARPYTLAFLGHALLDRLWFFPDTFYWPLRGWRFTVWERSGSEQGDIKMAYWYAFTRRRELWMWELGGLLSGLWFVIRTRLYKPRRLWAVLRTGRLPD